MKNNFTLVCMIWLSPMLLLAQTGDQIETLIYTNGIKASVKPAGYLFDEFQFPGYNTDPNLKISTISGQGIWISAEDENGNMRIAGVTYPAWGNDFVAGPIDQDVDSGWRRVFKVSAYEIIALNKDFDDNGTIDVIPSRALLEWPGKGNPHFYTMTGLQLPDREMAPFFDRNQNGIYDPYEGDYPILGNDCGDVIPVEMAWTLFHDNAIHSFSQSLEIKIEIATMVFSFGYTGIEVLDETVFVRQEIRNKSGKSLYDLRIGHFADINIGCSIDDALGCDPGQNTFFGYNRDEVDKLICPEGVPGYGYFPPVQTVTFLNYPLKSFMPFSTNQFVPWDAEGLNRYLHGIWPDGVPLTAAGNGYATSGPVTTYFYSDPPSNVHGWSSMTDSTAMNENMRGVGSSGVDMLVKDSSVIVYAAYAVHREDSLIPIEQVDFALTRIPIIQDFFDNCFTISGGLPELCASHCVWPGDLDNNGMVNNIDILPWGLRKGTTGPPRGHIFDGWYPQKAEDWGSPDNFPVPSQHIDANGNGLIELSDYYVIEQNYGLKNSSNIDWGGYNIPGDELYFERIFDSDTGYDTIISPGNIFRSRLKFQNPTSDPIYGLAFSMRFDTSLVNWQYTPTHIILANNPFTTGAQRFVRVHPNGIDVAITRTDGLPVYIENVTLLNISLQVTQASTPNPLATVNYQNYLLLNANGDEVPIGSKPLNVQFGPLTSLDNPIQTKKIDFNVFPNPGSSFLHIQATDPIDFIEILSVDGVVMRYQSAKEEDHILVNLDTLPDGLYLVKVCQGQGNCGIKYWVKMAK